ncbi:MAG: beta-ketoacyl synthase N-terminal-like domain-containing protein, partial [Desulfovibrionaceae bacterium]|nr:beta-ketoacyl synthase N-terminal-like domain-containing protein [Desulfovibrionaceae bacterium]
MSRPRIVITGLAGITPLANDMESTWKRLLAGESGIGPITHFDASAYDSRIAGEVKNFVAEEHLPAKQA